MHLCHSCSQQCRPPPFTASELWLQAHGDPSPICIPTFFGHGTSPHACKHFVCSSTSIYPCMVPHSHHLPSWNVRTLSISLSIPCLLALWTFPTLSTSFPTPTIEYFTFFIFGCMTELWHFAIYQTTYHMTM